jgi:predicted alpha/beta hydrolase family esterase
MKKLLILHCWFGTPNDNWYTYLKEEAEKLGYEVNLPQLNDKDNPTLEDWTKCALKDFILDENTSIVGHSLGALLGMKLVQNSKVKIDKLVLVSGWDFWDLTPEHKTFFNIPMNQEKIKSNCNHITVVHATNDPYITINQAEEMSKRLSADFIKIENGGHLQASDGYKGFPKIVDLL